MQNATRLISCLLIILSLSIPSCSRPKGNSLTICDNSKIDELLDKPEALATTLPGILLFAPLLFVDGNGAATNIIVKDVKSSHDNRSIEITIRDDVKLHDGRILTAHEVIISIDRWRHLDMEVTELLKGIKVQARGRYTINLTSEFPISDLISILRKLYVLPPASDPLSGSGPFMFSKWLENGLELAANEEYFEGRPRLDKIVYIYEKDENNRLRRLLNEEADLIVCISSETARFLKNDPRFHVKGDPFRYSAIFFNNESPILSNKVVRRAVAMAINRESIIKKAMMPATEKVLSPFPGDSQKRSVLIDYEPREAARLLEKEGWRVGKGGIREKDGKRLRISICYNEEEGDYNKVIDIISQHLFEVGIEVEGVLIKYNDFKKNRLPSGSYDAILAKGNFTSSSNFITWHTSYIGNPSGQNYSRYSNQEVDRLLEELKISSALERRKNIYARIEAIFYEDAPAALLYKDVLYTAVNKRFKGSEDFIGSVLGVYKIKNWSVLPEANLNQGD